MPSCRMSAVSSMVPPCCGALGESVSGHRGVLGSWSLVLWWGLRAVGGLRGRSPSASFFNCIFLSLKMYSAKYRLEAKSLLSCASMDSWQAPSKVHLIMLLPIMELELELTQTPITKKWILQEEVYVHTARWYGRERSGRGQVGVRRAGIYLMNSCPVCTGTW